jgi:ketosteroid isomerase-like protein
MERGDLDAIVALADPDVTFVNPDSALESGTRHGPEGLRAGLGGILDAFEHLRFVQERITDLGDRMLATGTFKGRGRGSGMELPATPFAIVITLREGRMVRFEWFADAAEAARAAGL